MNPNKLTFARGNAKLSKDTAVFSLPAGHTCMGAHECLSRAHKVTGKLKDGKECKFRCYAATVENLFRNIRKSRWHNFDLLKGKTVEQMRDLIDRSIPRKGIKLVRIHASGDFFSQAYFDAWMEVARMNPGLIFYGYTKALPFWIYRVDSIPANVKLTASIGGRFDYLIREYNLKSVKVVFSQEQAESEGLPIDHDDTLAWKQDKSFAVLLHGTQPPKSAASKALMALRKLGVGGYNSDYFAHYAKKEVAA